MFKISNKRRLRQTIGCLLLASLGTWTYAALDQQVVASGGGYTTSGDISFGYTIGQPFVPAQTAQFIAGFWHHGQEEELLPVTLVFSEPPDVISTCENFEITVRVEAPDDQEIDTVDVFLNFDPTLLKVIKVNNGKTLTWELANEIDNKKGHINFIASTLSPIIPKGSFDLMTVTLEAKHPTTQTGLAFATAKPRETNALLMAQSILGDVENIAFPVTNAGSLSGKVPNFKNHPLRVHVAPPIPETLYEVMTDGSGQFKLPNQFEVGEEYTVYVSWTNALQKQKSVLVPSACKTDFVSFGDLETGDVVGNDRTAPDNMINSFDVSMFRAYLSYKQSGEVDGIDYNIDYNLDGIVDAADSDPDFFLDMHFDLNNDGEVAVDDAKMFEGKLPPPTFGIDKQGGPYLKKGDRTTKSSLIVGENFKVTLEIDTNNQPVDVVEAFLQFDPDLLQVNGIKSTGYLDTVLGSKIDNNEGKIYFIAVQLLTEELPSGIFPLMTVDFTLLGANGEETLATEVLAIHGGLTSPDTNIKTVINDDTHTLAISKQGTGIITSDIDGIDCGTTCIANYPPETTVMLTATPANDFNKWMGDCQGTTNPLIIEMDVDKNCTAVFNTDLLIALGDFSVTSTSNDTLLITWQTLSENETLAFNLWRARPAQEGQCTKPLDTTDLTLLNKEPIDAEESDLGDGAFYSYEIPENLPDYCYGLEEIDSQGNQTFYIIGSGIDGWLEVPYSSLIEELKKAK